MAAGQLPPVAERLPRSPVIVQPVERIGTYGGTWRIGLIKTNPGAVLARTLGYEHVVRWDPDWTKVIPNVAHRIEVNDEATAYTFHLREGLRWSDGAPFTADDILFWYEAVFLNDELRVTPPQIWPADGQLIVEKVDEMTVIFRFNQPHGLFLQHLATLSGLAPTGVTIWNSSTPTTIPMSRSSSRLTRPSIPGLTSSSATRVGGGRRCRRSMPGS